MTVNPDRARKALDAVANGDLRTLQLMVRAGVPVDYVCPDPGRSLLSQAARSGQEESFMWLIEKGADPNIQEPSSWTRPTSLIECACNANYKPAIVAWILENASSNKEDLGRALRSIAYQGDEAVHVARMLLTAGAEPDFVDGDDDSSLFLAVEDGSETLALMLLEAGGSPTFRTTCPYREKHRRKTVFEVARMLGLDSFCKECATRHPEIKAKLPRIPKPKTAAECWAVIDHCTSNMSSSLACSLR